MRCVNVCLCTPPPQSPAMKNLPVEILREIFRYLSQNDCNSVSLVSSQMRNLTLPFIFGHLYFFPSPDTLSRIRNIHQAGDEIKGAIRHAFLKIRLYFNSNALSSLDYCFFIGKIRRLTTTLLFSTFWRPFRIFRFSTIIHRISTNRNYHDSLPLSVTLLYGNSHFPSLGIQIVVQSVSAAAYRSLP